MKPGSGIYDESSQRTIARIVPQCDVKMITNTEQPDSSDEIVGFIDESAW
jgi:hypothetical protein